MGEKKGYLDLLYEKDLSEIDSDTERIIGFEEERQSRKLILIPSESISPKAVRQALGSAFTNIYAEGYPSLKMSRDQEKLLLDFEYQLSYYRRYANRRFYKGCEYADFIESLAQKRIAQSFATDKVSAERIFVNIQPLSGAAANNSVYEAFLEPGDRVMGMNLFQGGHLTHGSRFNRSGKRYNVVSYGVNRETEKLDYEEIKKLALKHKPRMIIAGYTSYPWAPDWPKFREIADGVGAILLADIAHPAGMVIAGVYPSPLGYADVVTFTTHKTILGPRGAVILTTNKEKAEKIDRTVFPGEQGGPHVNKFAAIAVAFKISQSEEFKKLQKRIAENAKALADALRRQGLKLVYGGTDTHLLVIDLNGIKTKTGFPLKGEPATRILDLCGIVTNKNTIPGDESTALASGVRLGTPWLSQQGMGKKEMEKIAGLIHKVLTNIQPFNYRGLEEDLPRGKIDLEILEEVRAEVGKLVGAKDTPQKGNSEVLKISGERAKPFLQGVVTDNIARLKPGQSSYSFLLDKKGRPIDNVLIKRLNSDTWGRDHYLMKTKNRERVKTWLRGLSDGYIIFDEEDIFAKIEGPVVIKELKKEPLRESKLGKISLSKCYFVGQKSLKRKRPPCPKREFQYQEKKGGLKRTPLYKEHLKLTKKIIPFAGWEMPLWYTSISEEHKAVREKAALFDLGHMGILGISGEHSPSFLDTLTTNYVRWLRDGQSHYSYILDPEGKVMDDVMIYRLRRDNYMMVVNALNREKIKAWLKAVNSRQFIIDKDNSEKEVEGGVKIKTLEKVDLALQGPNSLTILQKLTKSGRLQRDIRDLGKNEFLEAELRGIKVLISHSGYSGEKIGYELYLSSQDAPRAWNLVLEEGEEFGIQPAGLGARDSTRIEAGLPLYGQELAGKHNISPLEAGYPAFVKFHKPFFIGREVLLKKRVKKEIIRFKMKAKGVRRINSGDKVLNEKSQYIGEVTSATLVKGNQRGMAYLDKDYAKEGTGIRINEEAVVLSRFPGENKR